MAGCLLSQQMWLAAAQCRQNDFHMPVNAPSVSNELPRSVSSKLLPFEGNSSHSPTLEAGTCLCHVPMSFNTPWQGLSLTRIWMIIYNPIRPCLQVPLQLLSCKQ